MSTYKSWIFLNFQKRGSFTEETHTLYVPKPIQSAPVTPCDSEASTWSDRASSSRQYYELPSTSDNARYDERPSTSDSTRYNVPSTSDKTRYEESMEGVWWWRRPLGVRRNQCRRCGASSATRPLRMMPCAGVAQEHDDLDWDGRRPLMSRERPLLFFRQLFIWTVRVHPVVQNVTHSLNRNFIRYE